MPAFVANTNVLELNGLKSEISGSYMNSAAVTVTIKDKNGVPVVGETWPLTMGYVAASNGNYRAIIKETLSFLPKQKYTAFIDADAGTNLDGHWEFSFIPQTRASADA